MPTQAMNDVYLYFTSHHDRSYQASGCAVIVRTLSIPFTVDSHEIRLQSKTNGKVWGEKDVSET